MIEGTPRFLSFRRKNHGWEEGKEKKGWTWRKEKERKKRKEIHDESVLESFASRPISIQSFSRIDATYFIWTITSDVRPHIEIWFLKTCYVGGCGRRRPLSTTRENLQCTCRFSDLYTEFENRFTNGKGYETCYFQRVCPTYKLAAIYGQPFGGWSGWLTWTIARSSSTFPQLVISLWSGGQLARNFEKFSLIWQPSLYNYIEAKIRIYIYRKIY